MDFTTNVVRITNACLKYGLVPNNRFQTVNGFTLFPKEYFCPKSYDDGKIYLTENTVAIHHFAGSWLTPKQKITERVVRMIGYDNFETIVHLKKKLFSLFSK